MATLTALSASLRGRRPDSRTPRRSAGGSFAEKPMIAALRRGDYQGAYRDWGCTPEKPCSAYPFTSFMRDWGPQSQGGTSLTNLGITDSESCNTGVLLTVAAGAARMDKLWVDKGDDAISFAPYPICPHKSPFAIMIHRTIGRLREPLLK